MSSVEVSVEVKVIWCNDVLRLAKRRSMYNVCITYVYMKWLQDVRLCKTQLPNEDFLGKSYPLVCERTSTSFSAKSTCTTCKAAFQAVHWF